MKPLGSHLLLLLSFQSSCRPVLASVDNEPPRKLNCSGVNAFEQQDFDVDLDVLIGGSSTSVFKEQATNVSLWTTYMLPSKSGSALLTAKGYWFALRPTESARFRFSACAEVDLGIFNVGVFSDLIPIDDRASMIDGDCSSLQWVAAGDPTDSSDLDSDFVEKCANHFNTTQSVILDLHPWYNYFFLAAFPIHTETVTSLAVNYHAEPLQQPNDAISTPSSLGRLPGSVSLSDSTLSATEDRVPLCDEPSQNLGILTGVWFSAETTLALNEEFKATATACRDKTESGPPVGLHVYTEVAEDLVCVTNLERDATVKPPCIVSFDADAGTRYLFFVYEITQPVPSFTLNVTLSSDATRATVSTSSFIMLSMLLLLFLRVDSFVRGL